MNANCRESDFMCAGGHAYFKDTDLAGANLKTTMQTFDGGWITDSQAMAALKPIVEKGLSSPHTTKGMKRMLRVLEKSIHRYRKQREEEE